MVWMFMLGAMKRKTPQRFYVLRKNYDFLMGGRGLGWFVVVLMAAPAIFNTPPQPFFWTTHYFSQSFSSCTHLRAVEP
jgi:hypothetical protein